MRLTNTHKLGNGQKNEPIPPLSYFGHLSTGSFYLAISPSYSHILTRLSLQPIYNCHLPFTLTNTWENGSLTHGFEVFLSDWLTHCCGPVMAHHSRSPWQGRDFLHIYTYILHNFIVRAREKETKVPTRTSEHGLNKNFLCGLTS